MNNAMSKHIKEGREQKAIMNNTTNIYKKEKKNKTIANNTTNNS